LLHPWEYELNLLSLNLVKAHIPFKRKTQENVHAAGERFSTRLAKKHADKL